MELTAVGIHVFAGGFTQGIQDAGHKVKVHLETHNFGIETSQKICNIEGINDEEANWPKCEGHWVFGNPRCTAFSTVTSGDVYNKSNAHGAFGKQTCDIHQLCEYAAGKYDVVIFESVQQCYTTGRELLNYLIKEHFEPKHYRIAHLFINAATFGNSQQRRRYFFVAYRNNRNFNIQPPEINPYQNFLYDSIYHLRNRQTNKVHPGALEYDFDSYGDLTPDEWKCLSHLPNGWGLNTLAQYATDILPEAYQFRWNYRISDLPFSLHAIFRLNWLRPAPTLFSSSVRWIHPDENRPVTIGELSTMMGWREGTIPVGQWPVRQISKGIVPAVGKWLAEQVELYFNNHWSSDDYESTFNANTGTWEGEDTTNRLEKIFDLTTYKPYYIDDDRYKSLPAIQSHIHNFHRPKKEMKYDKGI